MSDTDGRCVVAVCRSSNQPEVRRYAARLHILQYLVVVSLLSLPSQYGCVYVVEALRMHLLFPLHFTDQWPLLDMGIMFRSSHHNSMPLGQKLRI